ncbi:MAG TPA: arginine--tRNA ligase [Thermoanaerobaculia bacterium]|nr:arginine--tRNA ligase [Thermoanaerobaculia bacterium]
MNLEELIDSLTETLKARVLALWGVPVERVVIQTPPRLSMGDLATPLALELARAVRRPPREIAEAIAQDLRVPPLISGVSIEGVGYLNFRLDRGLFLATHLRGVMARPAPEARRITVEHTNINPNKAAHIGHLRNAVLGDTLVRTLDWLGNRVETQNYVDDTGVQVADVVVGFERILGEGIDQVRRRIDDPSVRFDYFCWDLYARTVRHYQENPDAVQWQQETLHRIEKQEGETAKLAAIVAEAIVRAHLRTAQRLGVEYDLLVKESDIIRQHFWDRAFELLKRSGAVVFETEGKHAGCWVMKLSDSPEFEGLEEPDKILVRSNGTVTYVGKDIAYQLWKFGLLGRSFEYRLFMQYPDGRRVWETTSDGDGDAEAPDFEGANQVFNVIDIRQSYLQKIVREGLRQLGHGEQAERSVHFSYEMVALSPATAAALGMRLGAEDSEKTFVEMSGRKGVGVKADDLMDALEAKALDAVREGLEGREPGKDEDQRALARQIAIGALRYFMLKYGRNKVIAFDFREALTFEGDSGPYLQYSIVRVENIFRKMADRGVEARLDAASLDELAVAGAIEDDIWEIVRGSAETTAVVRRAVETLELSTLTHHAFELGQKFNSFYHKYPILNEADPRERQKRAACAEVFRGTMRGILALLGIPGPERM